MECWLVHREQVALIYMQWSGSNTNFVGSQADAETTRLHHVTHQFHVLI